MLRVGLFLLGVLTQGAGGRIEGTVTAAETRQPIAGVLVQVEGTNRSAVTDVQGHYTIDGLPAGDVILLARRLGREPIRRSVQLTEGTALTANFVLSENAIRLSEVVVTATRDEERKANVAANVGVVGLADIQQSRPHHSAEIVNRVPGVLNIDLGGEGSTVAMRLPINYSAVYGYLEDGVPIRSTGFFNHNALYEINVPGADRVEVFKGPATALYGSDAIGGVFNVLTRAPSAAPTLELFAEGGAHDYARTLLSASNTWGSDGLRGDLNLMRYGGWRDGAHQNRQTGTLRWDHSLPSARLKTVVTFTSINSPGDGGSDIPLTDFENQPNTNYTPIAIRRVRALRWSTSYQRPVANGSFDVTTYARYNRLQLLPFWQLTYDPQIWDAHNYSLGLMTKYRRDFTRGSAIVGADVDYSPGTNVEDQIIPTQTASGVFNSYTTGERQYDYDVTFRGASPYVQLEYVPVARLHLSGGVRFDALGYDYHNALGVVDTGAHRRPASTSVSYGHFSPKAGVTLDLSPSVNLFAAYRHGFRVPSQEQLFVQGSATNSVGLNPVKANSFEAGLRVTGNRAALEVSAYTMDVTDDIVYFYNAATFTSEVSNAGRTRHRGVEASVKLALAQHWRLESAFAYVRNRYLQWITATGSDFSGHEMETGPRTIANTRLTFAPTERSALAAEWAHVGWYFTDPENAHRYDGYNILNFEATSPTYRGGSLVARVANITNEHYSVASSFNPFVPSAEQARYTPGLLRTLYLGIQYGWAR